uniref:Uncharacterized protein n=1 Tax=Panagrolaimus sp. ES5 TaxID=591445 RepID=A0AC34F5I8_9BILA
MSDVFHSNNLQVKKGSNSWNKSNKHLSTTFLNSNQERDELNKSKSVNSSTLSLHISAYENSIEAKNDTLNDAEKGHEKGAIIGLIKKLRISNDFADGSTSLIQNPFEFSRQQDDQANRHEMMNFKASQRLLNPNQMDANNQNRPSPVSRYATTSGKRTNRQRFPIGFSPAQTSEINSNKNSPLKV